MTRVDQFESVFRAASKPVFERQPVSIRKVLVVTDLPAQRAVDLGESLAVFLSVLRDEPELDWRFVDGEEFRGVGDLLALVEKESPDLICTYRHLHSDGWRWPHSLGEALDVLTQATPHPVLVIPRESAYPESADSSQVKSLHDTDCVMALTNHLTGDHRLVNFARRFLEKEGTLVLAHIEDDVAFETYMGAISKIPSIDTESAREEIRDRLLSDARDYIQSCREVLEAEKGGVSIEEIVTTGHRIGDCRRLIDEYDIDLLVMNTKDEEQLAMHGIAYPLAVELRDVPILML